MAVMGQVLCWALGTLTNDPGKQGPDHLQHTVPQAKIRDVVINCISSSHDCFLLFPHNNSKFFLKQQKKFLTRVSIFQENSQETDTICENCQY